MKVDRDGSDRRGLRIEQNYNENKWNLSAKIMC